MKDANFYYKNYCDHPWCKFFVLGANCFLSLQSQK